MTTSAARPRFALPDRLPPLRGRWLTLFGVTWTALLLVALAVGAYNVAMAQRPRGYAWMPLGLKTDYANIHVQTVSGAQARAEGIAVGDTIVAVDRVALERLGKDYAAIRASLRRREGVAVALTLRDARGRLIVHHLTYRAASRKAEALGLWVARITRSAAAVVLLGASTLLFRQRRRPVAALLAIALPCLTIAILGDQAFMHWFGTASDPYVLVNLACLLLLLALIGFPDGDIRSRVAKVLVCAAVIWTPMAIFLTLVHSERGIASFSFCAVLLVAVVELARRYRTMAVRERQQVRWALFGIAGYALATSFYVTAIVAPPRSADPNIMEVFQDLAGLLACLCLAGGLVISLLRYRLYDADAVIGRSAAYGVLTLGFVALFAGGEKVIEVVGERWFGEELGALAAGLGAALAAVLIVPLHHRVSRWAEHRFQKALTRLKQGVPLLMSDLRDTAAPDAIAAAALDEAMAAVHATRGAVIVGDAALATRAVDAAELARWRAQHPAIARDAVHDLFPTRVPLPTPAMAGWLLLGPRPDGTPVGKDEREALAAIAAPVARALAVAEARARREGALQAVLAGMEKRLVALEQRGAEAPGVLAAAG